MAMNLLQAKTESAHAVEEVISGLDPREGAVALVVGVDVREDGRPQLRDARVLTIPRQEVEERVLWALQEKLMRQDFFEEFCREFTKEMNRLRMEQRASLGGAKRELDRVNRDIRKVIDAIKAGFALSELKPEMDSLQARKETLVTQLEIADAPPPLLHSSMADRSSNRLSWPQGTGRLGIELRGNLAAMLTAANNAKRSPETGDLCVPMTVVAGAGFEPAAFGL